MEQANTYHVNIPLMIMAFVGYGVNIEKDIMEIPRKKQH